jgi:hypothetical protein
MTFRQDSGGSGISRRDECRRIIVIVRDHFDAMSSTDSKFVQDMTERLDYDTFEPSAKQLFWLRDIKDRIL